MLTDTIFQGNISEKWAGVQARLQQERRVIDACRSDRSHCTDRAAARFLDIVDEGRAHQGLALLGEINRAVNLAIRPVSDLVNYGEIDVWSPPLQTLGMGSGDCEDYAIAKMAALREAGVPSQDLRLVILHDLLRSEDHAVLAVRIAGEWRMLDNRMFLMLRDTQEEEKYQPLFVIDDTGVRAYRLAPQTPEQLLQAEMQPFHAPASQGIVVTASVDEPPVGDY